ncbi:MAG: class I SAM-dependent methyltransferase [Pirellulales bacterium]|nr:class I SAM-dependent methyltransferase [Pirellulales bacterium]
MEVVRGDIYDYPKYYDVLFGSDWKAEFDFLEDCFEMHTQRLVRRLFEPACGTGRLLIKFAKAGYEVAGIDLNPRAVDYCNKRLVRNGFAATTVLGDMSDFKLCRKADAAFNTINSFRHLSSETAAENHLKCMAAALIKGGIYVLGLHLTPKGPPTTEEECWSAQRGHLALASRLWSIEVDRKHRREKIGMTVDVYTPTRQFSLEDELFFRTYTAAQFQDLIDRTNVFEVDATYDFAYNTEHTLKVTPESEDVVYVLRHK